MYPIKHDNGRTDSRYTVTYEYCGFEHQMHVVRFCGDYLASFVDINDANEYAINHNEKRMEWRNYELSSDK